MIELFLGFLVGFWLGFFIICCVVAAKDDDKE